MCFLSRVYNLRPCHSEAGTCGCDRAGTSFFVRPDIRQTYVWDGSFACTVGARDPPTSRTKLWPPCIVLYHPGFLASNTCSVRGSIISLNGCFDPGARFDTTQSSLSNNIGSLSEFYPGRNEAGTSMCELVFVSGCFRVLRNSLLYY